MRETHGLPTEGDGDEGTKVRRPDLTKKGGGYDASGGRNQTSLGIHQQESGDGRGVSGPTANIRGLCKGDGINRRGEVVQAVAEIDGCGTTSEYHTKRYFGSSVGAVVIVIWQLW